MRNLKVSTSFTTKLDETYLIEKYATEFASVLAEKIKNLILSNSSYISLKVYKGSKYKTVSLALNIAPADYYPKVSSNEKNTQV